MGKLTPYFFFLKENRELVRNELAAAGQPTTIGAVGKALGLKWKSLTDEEKKVRRRQALGTNCVAHQFLTVED
eukprot:1055244-Pyramimonas_sp.AAC.1